MGAEVGWHLRFTREDELAFLVRAGLAPNVEDAVFMAGEWLLDWAAPSLKNQPKDDSKDGPETGPELLEARVRRKEPRKEAT